MSRVVDITNHRFGRLLVLRRKGTQFNQAAWDCLCDCGSTVTRSGADLRTGKVASCGCFKKVLYGDPVNRVFHTYKKAAAVRQLAFNLSRGQFETLIRGNCHYCGREPEQEIKVGAKSARVHPTFRYNGIDRMDNLKGYEPNNVVSCCRRCNRAKDTMTYSEFMALISAIYKRHIGGGCDN